MNMWQRTAILGGLAVAVVMLADTSLAAGKRTQSRSGSANGTVTRTATSTQTQSRQQLRDGSCLTGTTSPTAAGGTATGSGIRQQLRDGSCLTN
jgi:hypothetical protein